VGVSTQRYLAMARRTFSGYNTAYRSRVHSTSGIQMQEPDDKTEDTKTRRLCTYLLISLALQLVCVLMVGILVLWGTIQLLRLTNFLGVAQEPPGLAYYVDI